LRWRTNLARGEHVRQYEAAEAEVLSRVLAFEVQAALDEYKRANPDFPVRLRSGVLIVVVCGLLCARMDIDRSCENRNRIGRDSVQR
jgi:hypothetical protein